MADIGWSLQKVGGWLRKELYNPGKADAKIHLNRSKIHSCKSFCKPSVGNDQSENENPASKEMLEEKNIKR